MARAVKKSWRDAKPFWALSVFLLLSFLTGGASRVDAQSLVILYPAAAIFGAVGLWSLSWTHIRENRFLFGMAAATYALLIIHLIPLPPSVWSTLPGREFIRQIDKAAQLGAVWRPISMVPSATWQALYSLSVPLAVLLLGVQLNRQERFNILWVMLAIGLLSGLWAMLQIMGDPQGVLYTYRVTNNGAAVGLFANRNHQAILLASIFPMLAVAGSAGAKTEDQLKMRGYAAIAIGTVVVPLLLVTGSRAGFIIGFVALGTVPLLYRKPSNIVPKKRKGNKLDLRWLLIAFGVLCLGALTVIMSRAEAFQRLSAPDQAEELRGQMWPYIAQMGAKYFPLGSGVGSFVEVYQIDEPHHLLSPEYVNHAHNDWLELFMTTGLPGVTLIAICILAAAKVSVTAFRKPLEQSQDRQFARLGAITLLILALGSVGDYPLRTPSMSCVLVIAALWLAKGAEREPKNAGIA